MLRKLGSNKIWIVQAVSISVLCISSLAIFGWLIDSFKIITVFSETATMKFNTALGLWLCGLCLLMPPSSLYIVRKIVLGVILGIGLITVLEYIFLPSFTIDNLFLQDKYSIRFPGRMSLGTAICFILLAMAMFYSSRRAVREKRKALYFLSIIVFICFLSIITFVLQIPLGIRLFLIDTMSISTSVLFLLLSLAQFKKNDSYGLARPYLKDLAGNKMVNSLLFFVMLFPLILSYLLLFFTNSGLIDFQFGIIIYTVLLTFSGIIYVFYLGVKLNKVDFKKKKLEQFFRDSNQELKQFKYALDQSSLITIFDGDGIVKYANDKFCEVSQYSKEEIIGRHYGNVSTSFYNEEFYAEIRKKLEHRKVWYGGIKRRAKDGSIYWVHAAIIPFHDDMGYNYQNLAILQDITTQKVLAEDYENLKLKSAEIEQFSYIASHDLQEPLNTLRSILGLMEEEYGDKLDDNAKKYMEFMTQTSTRMEDLIKGLLDYSRLGRDGELLEVNTKEVVSQVFDDLSYVIGQNKANVLVEKLPVLQVYPVEFRLLLQNLISNSAKFNRKGVTPEIKISAEDKLDYWEFKIADNGIGIEAEHSQKVFAIFARLNDKRDFEGTGIGLAHCEKIVRLHGGTIWFESELGVGTTFYFTINKNLN